MQHIAPLLQTVFWVGFFGFVLWHFHKPIYDLLVALGKRVENGSGIKAGPFEIAEQMMPQAASQQRENAALDVAEVMEEPEPEPEQGSAKYHLQKSLEVQAKYLQAEDLVFRAIQAEYGVAVIRKVTAGSDFGFDGAFVSNRKLNIVEVKYLARSSSHLRYMLESVDRIVASISRYRWGSTQIILL